MPRGPGLEPLLVRPRRSSAHGARGRASHTTPLEKMLAALPASGWPSGMMARAERGHDAALDIQSPRSELGWTRWDRRQRFYVGGRGSDFCCRILGRGSGSAWQRFTLRGKVWRAAGRAARHRRPARAAQAKPDGLHSAGPSAIALISVGKAEAPSTLAGCAGEAETSAHTCASQLLSPGCHAPHRQLQRARPQLLTAHAAPPRGPSAACLRGSGSHSAPTGHTHAAPRHRATDGSCGGTPRHADLRVLHVAATGWAARARPRTGTAPPLRLS